MRVNRSLLMFKKRRWILNISKRSMFSGSTVSAPGVTVSRVCAVNSLPLGLLPVAYVRKPQQQLFSVAAPRELPWEHHHLNRYLPMHRLSSMKRAFASLEGGVTPVKLPSRFTRRWGITGADPITSHRGELVIYVDQWDTVPQPGGYCGLLKQSL